MEKLSIENKKSDYLSLNVLKGLAMFLVLFYHFRSFWFHNNFSECNSVLYYYLLSFTSLGVPIFFLVNGFLLFNKESFDWKKWGRKMFGMAGMTFFWSVIIELFQFWFNSYDEWDSFWANIYTGKYLNFLWFIKSLLVVYMIFPVIWLAYKYIKDNKLEKRGMYIYIFFLLASAFGNNLILMIANITKYFTEGTILSSNGTYGFLNKFLADFCGGVTHILLRIL